MKLMILWCLPKMSRMIPIDFLILLVSSAYNFNNIPIRTRDLKLLATRN